MKLCIYVKCYAHWNVELNFSNTYEFYSQFIYAVVSIYLQRKDTVKSKTEIEQELNRIAATVFESFKKSQKQIPYHTYVAAILKMNSQETVSFIHETFFEYFVARNYICQLNKDIVDSTALSVFYQNYSNPFADFITSALKTKNTTIQKNYIDKLCEIYFGTLSKDVQELYMKHFNPPEHIVNRKFLYNLSPNDFFSLKYEIVFRLGRLCPNNKNISDFLGFIYVYDKNIRQSQKQDYMLAILRRCCAISSSFLASEKIELDYVNHMLPFRSANYDPNYDLANRSHTLLYYGDVTQNTIFTFWDDDPNIKCSNAFRKRIKRLEATLPESVANMNDKQKRTYLFRLFDLATIYTFMYNRKQKLSREEYDAVANCFTAFQGASIKRQQLMAQIQNEIISLNNQYSTQAETF